MGKPRADRRKVHMRDSLKQATKCGRHLFSSPDFGHKKYRVTEDWAEATCKYCVQAINKALYSGGKE